jgi:hypothetical protein
MSNEFDYDLNIFQRELQVGLDADAFPIWDYAGPWYIHIYECEPGDHRELGEPIELTESEANNLIKVDPYFDDEVDTWYGLAGFIAEKHAVISDRLMAIFDALPKYKEEVLFN